MGLETAAIIAIGGAAAGGVGGAIAGAAGTPDQITRAEVPEKSPLQTLLEDRSRQQFESESALVDEQQAALQGFGGLQQAGIGAAQGILGGGAFALTAEEQARTARLRDARVSQARGDLEALLGPQLQSLESGLARRGLRGQAAQTLRAETLVGAGQELGRVARSADVLAAQQELQLPGQRAGVQAQLALPSANFLEQRRQQAILNRERLQQPFVLGLENQARLAGRSTIQQGQPGSALGAVGGFLGGAGQGFGTGATAAGALSSAGAFAPAVQQPPGPQSSQFQQFPDPFTQT